MAMTSTGMLPPKTATSTAASAMPGKAMMTSSTRMSVSSTALREVAAIAPSAAPATRASPVAPRPMSSDQRAPYRSLDRMSRLALSRPIQCRADGPPPATSWKYGECGAIHGASTAASTTTTMTPTETHAAGVNRRVPPPGLDRRSVSPRLMWRS